MEKAELRHIGSKLVDVLLLCQHEYYHTFGP